jgi:hypothetical protein
VFSGRPNPHWKLDTPRSNQLRALQERLSETDRAPADPPGLGYRGFVYTDATETSRAYKGYVRTPRSVLDDPKFTVERFLLNTLLAEYSSLRARVEDELAGPD